jgi:NTP pyrophosphatase (non-canonical NTP hydrolase)
MGYDLELEEYNDVTWKELTKDIQMFGKDNMLYFATALAGEVGEFCNLVKKEARDGDVNWDRFGEELADVFIYLHLTAEQLGIDLPEAILKKVKEVNEKRNLN